MANTKLSVMKKTALIFAFKVLQVLWMICFVVSVSPRCFFETQPSWWCPSTSVELTQEEADHSGPRSSTAPWESNTRHQSLPIAQVGRLVLQPTRDGLYWNTARTPKEDAQCRRRCTRKGYRKHTHPRCCRTFPRKVRVPCGLGYQRWNRTSWLQVCRTPNQ